MNYANHMLVGVLFAHTMHTDLAVATFVFRFVAVLQGSLY